MFEKAARLKLRFNFRGVQSAEDLWDFTPENLDTLYRALKAEYNKQSEESLLQDKSAEVTLLDLKIALVKYVFEVLSAEKKARIDRKKTLAELKRIREAIAEKQSDSLRASSLEELRKLEEQLAGNLSE